jgi:hypothetical protein
MNRLTAERNRCADLCDAIADKVAVEFPGDFGAEHPPAVWVEAAFRRAAARIRELPDANDDPLPALLAALRRWLVIFGQGDWANASPLVAAAVKETEAAIALAEGGNASTPGGAA